MSTRKVGGLSLSGAQQEKAYLCLLTYFEEANRWIVENLDEITLESWEVKGWDHLKDHYGFESLVVDFPLTTPPCENCPLNCPGLPSCADSRVRSVFFEIEEMLVGDQKNYQQNPKLYERIRIGEKSGDILSKSFKRRLKKGFIPYWHRVIDFWIWLNYYDEMRYFFRFCYESYGTTSLFLLQKLKYLHHHSSQMVLYESNFQLILIELLRSEILSKSKWKLYSDEKLREWILGEVEKKLNIFLYGHEEEILIRSPKAFASFLLSLAGQCLVRSKKKDIPEWVGIDRERWVIPNF